LSTLTLDEIRKRFEESNYFQQAGFIIERFDEDGAKLKLELQPHHLNVNGTLHGAVHAALLDQIFSMHIRSTTRANCSTINLNVQYLTPCHEGTVYATAKFLQEGYRTAILEGEVVHENGTVIANGIGIFKLVRNSKR